MKRTLACFLFAAQALATQASADFCDYRLSALLSGKNAASLGTATSDLATKAYGYYTLTNAVTGTTMLGSSAAVGSTAGTLAFLTGAGLATVGAALTNPIGIVIGAVVAVGAGGAEGYCHFRDDRITDYNAVLLTMRALAENADPSFFRLEEPTDSTRTTAAIFVRREDGVSDRYTVDDLYIVNGLLKHRKFGRDTVIGNLGLAIVESTAE
ncbi:hypothetical protein [Pontibaca salina]|uniref:Uncharacterized protein n=1 Tax=Pontibaca salina TaxID=2795731 RepID=A0A934M0R5_9RHOB|nr:hypothetical protein [Pontibaca salina]MBI6630280.1 hypothetical protein [Pontibaca salina]